MTAVAQAASGLLVLLASAGWGAPALRWIGMPTGRLESVVLGHAVAAAAIQVLAWAGLANPVAGWLVCMGGLTLRIRHRSAESGRERGRRPAPDPDGSPDPEARILMAVIGGLAAFAFASAMVPPITYDTVSYQLVVPQQYLLSGRAAPMPWFLPSALPFTVHAGYLWAMELGGGWRGPAVLNWAAGLGCTIAVFRLALAAGLSRAAGLRAALIWQATPMVLLEMHAPLSDLQTGLAAMLALASCLRGGRGAGHSPGWAAGAVWVGVAASCKYPGGLVMAAVLVAALRGRTRPSPAWRRWLVAGGLAALPVLPVLARNALVEGAPLYPFLTGAAQGDKVGAWNRAISQVPRAPGEALWGPVRMVWDGQAFALRDLWQTGATIASLVLLPWFLVRRRSGDAVAGRLAALAGLGYAVWILGFYQYWLIRYVLFIPAIGAVLWAGLARRPWPARLVLVAVLASDLPHAGTAASSLRWWAAAGFNDARYLGSVAPVNWPWSESVWLRDRARPGDRVATVFEAQVFWTGCRVSSSVMGDISLVERILSESRDADEVLDRLARRRVRWLLFADAVDEDHARIFLRGVGTRQMALLREVLGERLTPAFVGPGGYRAVYAVPPRRLTGSRGVRYPRSP